MPCSVFTSYFHTSLITGGVCSLRKLKLWGLFLGESRKGHISLFTSLQMNRTKGDEEEYWNSSKFKAFTFDDEDDELSQVGFHKQLLKVAPSHTVHPSPCILGNLVFDHISIRLRSVSVRSLEKSSWGRTLRERDWKTNSLPFFLYILNMSPFFQEPRVSYFVRWGVVTAWVPCLLSVCSWRNPSGRWIAFETSWTMTMTTTWKESAGAGNLWEVSRGGPEKGSILRLHISNKGSSILVRKGNEVELFSDEDASGSWAQEKILGEISSGFHTAV